jgi:RHS repeat-associated protein
MPDGTVVRRTYNDGNLLGSVDATLPGAGQPTTFVRKLDYDARGKRMAIEYPTLGPGGAPEVVRTEWTYDRESFRLERVLTTRPSRFPAGRRTLQHSSYVYDPVGNVLSIDDHAQQAIFFRNRRIGAGSGFVYDAIYRLIEASGREHLGQTGPRPPDHAYTARDPLPHPADGNAMGRYVERYSYDEIGNLARVEHRGTDPVSPGWNRTYAYGTGSHLAGTATRGTPLQYRHDAHGNLTRMPHLANHPDPDSPNLHWDHADRPTRADLGGGGTVFFAYDARGQRVRKVWRKAPGLVEERIYLSGLELFRRRNGGGAVTLERTTLHVTDGARTVALVERRTQGNDAAPASLTRYQLSGHLASVALELDDQARVISYEEYYPYGSTSFSSLDMQFEAPRRYGHSGKERDEGTGLVYYGARYYAPWLGRWCSCDPAADGPDSNLYSYCGDNPTSRIDPDGRADYGEQGGIGEELLKRYFDENSDRFFAFEEFHPTNQGGFDPPVVYDMEADEVLFMDNKTNKYVKGNVSSFRPHRYEANRATAIRLIERHGGKEAELAMKALGKNRYALVVANAFAPEDMKVAKGLFERGYRVLDLRTGVLASTPGEMNKALALSAKGIKLGKGGGGGRAYARGAVRILSTGAAVAGVAGELYAPIAAAEEIDAAKERIAQEIGVPFGHHKAFIQGTGLVPISNSIRGQSFMFDPKGYGQPSTLYRIVGDVGEAAELGIEAGDRVKVAEFWYFDGRWYSSDVSAISEIGFVDWINGKREVTGWIGIYPTPGNYVLNIKKE